MAVTPAEHSGEVRAALSEIVAEHGPEALSNASMMSNLLKDLLPDAPQVARMLVAAAEDRIADELRGHVAQGLDADTAAGLATSLFAGATMFSPQACAWVVGELAVALGLSIDASREPAAPPLPPEAAGPGPGDARPGTDVGPTAAPATVRATLPEVSQDPPRAASSEPDGPDSPASGGAVAGRRRWRLSRRIAVLAVAVALAATAAVTATVLLSGGSAAAIAYVTNKNGTITPIDLGSGRVGQPIEAGSGVSLGPIAISENGATAYAVDTTNGTILPVNLATRAAGQAIAASFFPAAIAFTPDGKTAYVTGNGTVLPVNVATGAAGQSISVGDVSQAIAIAPDGKTAYVTATNEIVPIDLATDRAGAAIAVSGYPQAIAITPDSKTAYVIIDGMVVPIDLSNGRSGRPIDAGGDAASIAVAPDGRTAYAANLDGTVTPIDLATGQPGPPIKAGGNGSVIVLAPGGQTAYVLAGNAVVPINLAAATAGRPIVAARNKGLVAIAIG